MSNREKEKEKVDDTLEEKEYSDEQWSEEEEYDTREIVLALPALSISRERFGVSSVLEEEEEEARLNEQAIVAAELVMAAAEEAVMKEKSDGKKKQKLSRQKKTRKTDDRAGGSGQGGESKKRKKKASELTNPPEGPPVCNICGRAFRSWKAVFGHLRSHKDRNYQGFNPPPKFSAVSERFMIPGPNSAFVVVTAGGRRSGGFVAAPGGAPGGEGGRGLGIDLNVDPVEEDEEEEATETRADIAKFDLNKSPPKDEDEMDKAK